jgi:cytochrome o ubiquinol oxidase subunit 2
VWNVFFVPQMGTMIYTMPRMTTRLNLQANRAGAFPGRSAHFSGDGFSGMRFNVQAVPPQQFAAWAASAHGSGLKLDGAAYAELSKPSSYMKPMTFGTVAPGLYDAIVANRAPMLHLPQAAPARAKASATPPGG